ncbi:hypothetical protein HYQ36_gp151 [Salmonella phage moki]|uniref:Uncharacterized protein n=1 Tax=Salmonella phage moki TaxID=2713306 RepID=A0A6G9LCQ3_9CAUD|nr:hypothetical protein HYQ36_gp151 [Salmonella phage moki]QIQ62424.1 hypothetical protein moki_151 [Salmonella phage moki]
MISLKEMYERLEELKSKERLYSEENAEMSDLIEKIALREKYLQRYINHSPHMVERMSTILELDNSGVTGKDLIVKEVHSMVSLGQIFGRADQDDMIFLLEKALIK